MTLYTSVTLDFSFFRCFFFVRTADESRSRCEVRDEREAIDLFIPPPCGSSSSLSVCSSCIKLSRASFLPQHVPLQKNIPPHTCRTPPFGEVMPGQTLSWAAATMWQRLSSLTLGKCKDSRDRLKKTSARRTVNAEALAPPLAGSQRPGRFGPGLVERRDCGSQRR